MLGGHEGGIVRLNAWLLILIVCLYTENSISGWRPYKNKLTANMSVIVTSSKCVNIVCGENIGHFLLIIEREIWYLLGFWFTYFEFRKTYEIGKYLWIDLIE